jgi:hypothetical protein
VASTRHKSAESLGRIGSLDALEPCASAPTESALVVQIPPGEAIGDLRAINDPKYRPFIEHFRGPMEETRTSAETKPGTFGAYYSDIVSDSDAICARLRRGRRFGRQEQGGIQTSLAEVLFADSAKLHGFGRRPIHMPLDTSALEVLGDHPRLHGDFAYRGTEHVRATSFHVEREKGETDVVSSIGEVSAEPASNQRVGYCCGARRAMTKQFPKWTQLHLAGMRRRGEALHPCALEVLNGVTVFFDRFRDGRPPGLNTTVCLEKGEEGISDVVACRWKVLDWRFLGLTWIDEEKHRNN